MTATTIDSLLVPQLDALLYEETNFTANLANASALLMQTIPDLNWAGFYLYDEAGEDLILGPFQGKVACMHIKPGKGVVGTSFAQQAPILVPNVHEFPGHIACDAASNSEIVIPLVTNDGKQLGVLDIDSPSLNRFSEDDQTILVDFVKTLVAHI
ncbi:GAF domain-containing protein [Periweissella cryptocerci]|uniref:GAF domain-containing protein n=1 Tax=Periweissella cryptocerci TaxID=2506420 RepID=A0A4V1AIU3_9LACO|nr:GAF domain-containing protein [Periweissella cryptocerci]QBO36705.1 GAF domain-containing protein [Periweissella cryptocerci]